MQIEHKSLSQPLFFHLINSCNTQIQIDFLQFLETETVFMIALSAKKHKKQQQFFKLALVYAYFKTYLNRIDRSYYYLFYEQKQFLNLQKGFIINLTKTSYQTFCKFSTQYQQNFQILQKTTNFLTLTNSQQEQQGQQQQQLKRIIQNIFFQTDYPLPQFLRETIGIYSNTPFQQFLLLIRFPTLDPPQQYIELPLIKLRQYFQEQDNLKKIIELICENLSQNLDKMSILKYCPYEYQKINWQSIHIDNFTLHNFIVILYQLIFINAKVNKRLIQQHKDPIMKIAEFLTRANIYKNIIISIEEKFGFLFQLYQDIYENLTKNPQHNQLPKFKFWNGAMTIWNQQFKQMENQLFQSYNYILLRQREINLKRYLQQKSQSFPSIYNSLKYEVQKNSLFENLKSQVYENTGQLYQKFFQNNIDSYQVLSKEFLEHQVDSSINQLNVHKIGHSQHVVKRIPFFNNFIQNIKKVSNSFYQHIQKLIYKVIPDKHMRLGTLKDLIKNDFAFINGKFTRPVILREILSNSQDFIKSLIDAVPQFAVFSQEAVQKFGLHWDFSHEDNLLDYFSSQAQIPDDCPIQLRSFFDTHKQLAAHQMISLANSFKLQSQIAESQMQEQYEQSSFQNQSFYSSQDF